MKFYFIFLNIFLAILSTILVLLHFQHQAPQADSVLNKTPKQFNNKVKPITEIRPPFPISKSFKLAANNIFDPLRGKVETKVEPPPAPKPAPPAQKTLELIGVCKMQNIPTAIIKDKGSKNSQSKHYYRLGEKMDNGYEVAEISFTSVVLKSSDSTITIDIDRKDSDSTSRGNALPPIVQRIPPPSVTPIPPAATAAQPDHPQPPKPPTPGPSQKLETPGAPPPSAPAPATPGPPSTRKSRFFRQK